MAGEVVQPAKAADTGVDSSGGISGRVAVGLSGGVDSAVAAALLVEQGLDVVGVHLRLRDDDNHRATRSRARLIAQRLRIPLLVPDAREAFRLAVVDHFVAEYAAGRTPSPCTVCNPTVKFRFLLDGDRTGGAGWAATGHYARLKRTASGTTLLRGADRAKDQSYFLYALGQAQLARILFPLGNLAKNQVREIAQRFALPVARAPESQDICFIPDGDYRGFLRQSLRGLSHPGPILDLSGRFLGEHAGVDGYTVGQRKGLGISATEPLYVKRIDIQRNALIVGSADDLLERSCAIRRLSFISGEAPASTFAGETQIRYRAHPESATVTLTAAASAHVRFENPQRAVTPGQSLVLYNGETVLGGGVISSAP